MIKTIHDHQQHLGWDNSLPAALTVTPGEELVLELQDASGNRVQKNSTADLIPTLLPDNANPLTGPVWVDGAQPGDTLVVDLLDYAIGNWGWTAIFPEFGLLSADFPDPYLHTSEYNAQEILFTDDIRLPTRPFAGTIGVAPANPGHFSAIPPLPCGGNMDLKTLTRGARLYLPVQVPGALFSVGDGHAVQGHGEVCGTAIETQLSVRVKLSLIKQQSQPFPSAQVVIASSPGQSFVTTGIGPDLLSAARDAVRFMIEYLTKNYQLEPELAYCLCSVAGDLSIAEVVNAPQWTLCFNVPTGIFR